MEFFPFRRDRAAADAKMDEFRDVDRRRTATASPPAEIMPPRASASALSASLEQTDMPFLPAGTIEIGWRLAANSGAKAMSPRPPKPGWPTASRRLAFAKIVSFAVENNSRSTARHGDASA